MKHTRREQTIALAGIYQAAALVNQIANTGSANTSVIESSLESLFTFNTSNVEQVYGNLAGVRMGLDTLCDQLNITRNNYNNNVTRYVISLLVLEKKLSRNKEMLTRIEQALVHIQTSIEFFSLMHDSIISKLGNLYKETISTLGTKIIVSGEKPVLSNEINAHKVRALLLAGIRSSVLWRQCGGSRWQILFRRKSYLHECDKLLMEV